MSPRTSGSKLMRCINGDDDKLYLVTIQCDGQPHNGPEGFWDIISAVSGTPVSGQPKCSGGGKTANNANWIPF